MYYWTWCRGQYFQSLRSSGFCPSLLASCSARHVEWTHKIRHQGTARYKSDQFSFSFFLLLKSKFTFLFGRREVSYYVAPHGQTHHPPASTFWMLESQTCATVPSLHFIFLTFVLQFFFHSSQRVWQYSSLIQFLGIHVQWNLFSLPFMVLHFALWFLSYQVPRTPTSTLA